VERAEESVIVNQTETDWHTWTDAELLTRLLRRQVDPVTAKGWVRDRALDDIVAEIEAVLGATYKDANDKPQRLELPFDRRARR
jgi:hypothetical protein